MVKRHRRSRHETSSGVIINVILTEKQYRAIRLNKSVLMMVEGQYFKIHPPIDSKRLKKIVQLQAQIRALKKGAPIEKAT